MHTSTRSCHLSLMQQVVAANISSGAQFGRLYSNAAGLSSSSHLFVCSSVHNLLSATLSTITCSSSGLMSRSHSLANCLPNLRANLFAQNQSAATFPPRQSIIIIIIVVGLTVELSSCSGQLGPVSVALQGHCDQQRTCPFERPIRATISVSCSITITITVNAWNIDSS